MDLSIDFKLDKLLFGAMKLTKTIAFDSRWKSSLPGGSWVKNVTFLEVDNSSSVPVDNK